MRAAVTQLQIRKDMSWPKTDVKVCMKKTFSKKTDLCSREMKKNHKDKADVLLKKLSRTGKNGFKQRFCWG